MIRKLITVVVCLLCSLLCNLNVAHALEATEPVMIVIDSDQAEIEEVFTTEIDIYPERILQRQSDVDLLARLIETEAGSDFIPLEEKVKVGLTVLHRCDSPAFPDTVEENIYKPRQYAKPSAVASPMSLLAAEDAMYLWENGFSYQILPSEALYFNGDGRKNHFKDADGNIYK